LSRVRVRLSGALAFAANLLGYVTGFLFTVFVTRRISERDFGVWALINSLISYSLTPFNLVSQWITRDAARRGRVFKSSSTLYLSLTPFSIAIYLSAGLLVSSGVGYDFGVIALGIAILVPYICVSLGSAIQGGYAPQYIGLSGILFEVSKILVALYLVVLLRLGLVGALLTISAAYFVQASLLLYESAKLREERVSRELMFKWLKGAPLMVIPLLSGVLAASDVVLMSIMTGDPTLAGYLRAAVTASALVSSSSALATGLGPRLLSGGSETDVNRVFSYGMMFMIPMLIGFLILSKDILWILKPSYTSVYIASCLLALSNVAGFTANIAATSLASTDKFDINEGIGIIDYFKSRVSLVNLLNFVFTSLYVISLGAILFVLKNAPASLSSLTALIAGVALIFAVVRAASYIALMYKLINFRLRIRVLSRYALASIPMAVAVYLLRSSMGAPGISVHEAALKLVYLTLAGGLIYFAALYLISGEFRQLVREVRLYLGANLPH